VPPKEIGCARGQKSLKLRGAIQKPKIEIAMDFIKHCGSCTACCRLLPVKELLKPALKKCQYQSTFKGCRIYETRPNSCRAWSCVWLLDSSAPFRRPDRVGYVVDPVPDIIVLGEDAVNGRRLSAVQVWVDPNRPDAHRDPDLRAWFAARATNPESAIIVRSDQRHSIVVVPPWLSENGKWIEIESRVMPAEAIRRLRSEMWKQAADAALAKKESKDE
jgi:hypothetical protein